jgi:hypothetical protein
LIEKGITLSSGRSLSAAGHRGTHIASKGAPNSQHPLKFIANPPSTTGVAQALKNAANVLNKAKRK